jgi:DNA-binding NarL/FixJ family response regulator
VVLADDHQALRRSLRLLLERAEDLRVVGEAGDLETALQLVAAHRTGGDRCRPADAG